jgi:hypothetical protein
VVAGPWAAVALVAAVVLLRPRTQPGEREELFGAGLQGFLAEVGIPGVAGEPKLTQMHVDLEEMNRRAEAYRVDFVGHHRCSMTEP